MSSTTQDIVEVVSATTGNITKTIILWHKKVPSLIFVDGPNPVPATGGTQHWRFGSTSYRFHLSELPSWLTVTDGSGTTYTETTPDTWYNLTAAEENFYLTFAPNDSTEVRSNGLDTEFPFEIIQGYSVNTPGHTSGYEYPMIPTFSQEGKALENYIVLNPNSVDIPYNPQQSQTVVVSANTSWTAVKDDPWVEFIPSTGQAGTTNVYVGASSNSGTSRPRTSSVKFIAPNSAVVSSLAVTQSGNPLYFSIEITSPEKVGGMRTVDSGTSIAAVYVEAGSEWWFVGTPDFISSIEGSTNVKPNNQSNPIPATTGKTFYPVFAVNSATTPHTYVPQIGHYTNTAHTQTGATYPPNSDFIYQEAGGQGIFSWGLDPISDRVYSSGGGDTEFSLSAVTNWCVDTANSSWLSTTPQTGTGGYKFFELVATANASYANGRSSYIDVLNDQSAIQFTVNVYQLGSGGYSNTLPTTKTFTATPDSDAFTVYVNTVVPFVMTIRDNGDNPVSWIVVRKNNSSGVRYQDWGTGIKMYPEDFSGLWIGAERNAAATRYATIQFTFPNVNAGVANVFRCQVTQQGQA